MFRYLALSVLLAGTAAAADTVEWLGSYRQGLERARETGKPLLVEFRCEA